MEAKKIFAMMVLGLLALGVASQAVFAQPGIEKQEKGKTAEDILKVSAGITPDSPFYGLKRFGEDVGLFFTLDPLEKAKSKYGLAEMRLVEAEKMAELEKPELTDAAIKEYEKNLKEVESEGIRLSAARRDTSSLAALAEEKSYRHALALQKLHEEVAESEKPEIETIMENSLERHGSIAEREAEMEMEREIETEQERGREKERMLVDIPILLEGRRIVADVPADFAEKFLENEREAERELKEKVEIEDELNLKKRIAQRVEIKEDDAKRQIEDARGKVAEAELKLSGMVSQPSGRLLELAREHLRSSEQSMGEDKVGAAFGHAIAAERLATNAGKLADTRDEARASAEIIGNAAQAKVEVRFATDRTEKNAIAQEILKRLRIDKNTVSGLLRLEAEPEENRLKDEKKIEAVIRDDVSRVRAELRFPVNSSSRDGIAEGIAKMLSGLKAEDIEKMLDVEIKENQKELLLERIEVRKNRALDDIEEMRKDIRDIEKKLEGKAGAEEIKAKIAEIKGYTRNTQALLERAAEISGSMKSGEVERELELEKRDAQIEDEIKVERREFEFEFEDERREAEIEREREREAEVEKEIEDARGHVNEIDRHLGELEHKITDASSETEIRKALDGTREHINGVEDVFRRGRREGEAQQKGQKPEAERGGAGEVIGRVAEGEAEQRGQQSEAERGGTTETEAGSGKGR